MWGGRVDKICRCDGNPGEGRGFAASAAPAGPCRGQRTSLHLEQLGPHRRGTPAATAAIVGEEDVQRPHTEEARNRAAAIPRMISQTGLAPGLSHGGIGVRTLPRGVDEGSTPSPGNTAQIRT